MYLTPAQLQIVRLLCDMHLAKLGEPEAGEVQALLSAIEETKMTTPNIEELIAECRDFDTSVYLNAAHANSGLTSKLQDAADALQSQTERIKVLEAKNKECVRCLGEALQEATDCHTALHSEDELPEPEAYRYRDDCGHWVYHRLPVMFAAAPDEVEYIYTERQLRQAQAMVRAKMVPLKDAFAVAYWKACRSSMPDDWLEAALVAQQILKTEDPSGITGEPK